MGGREVTTDKIFYFTSGIKKKKSNANTLKIVEQATTYNKGGWS